MDLSLLFCLKNAKHEMLCNIDEFIDMNVINAEFEIIREYFIDTFYDFCDENNNFCVLKNLNSFWCA